MTRPIPDEAMCALLWEYKDRGRKGYDLTARFFFLFRDKFADLIITGPERAGKHVLLGSVFDKYPNPLRPVDFVIYDSAGKEVLAIGLAATIQTGAEHRKTIGQGVISTARAKSLATHKSTA